MYFNSESNLILPYSNICLFLIKLSTAFKEKQGFNAVYRIDENLNKNKLSKVNLFSDIFFK